MTVEDVEIQRFFIKMGSTTREATRQELLRLFQRSALLHYEILERKEASLEHIDFFRVREYLRRFSLGEDLPQAEVEQLLINKKFLTSRRIPTLAGSQTCAAQNKKIR